MESDAKVFLGIVLSIAAVLISVVVCHNANLHHMISQGYSEVQAVGTSDVLWVKK